MQQCQVRVFHNFCLIQMKNGLHNGGLNPGPLGHESSALTTRPRLLARMAVVTSAGVTLLFTGGCCWEVVLKTGLTVLPLNVNKMGHLLLLQWKPLNVITFGPKKTENINRITCK